MFDSADSIEKPSEQEIRVKKAKMARNMLLVALFTIGLALTHLSYLLTRACHYKEAKIRSSGKCAFRTSLPNVLKIQGSRSIKLYLLYMHHL